MNRIIKKSLYPKTKRLGANHLEVSEKLDGSNLGIFNQGNRLLIAQRNTLFYFDDLTREQYRDDITYKGLGEFVEENYDELLPNMHEGSGFFCEYIGNGSIGYGEREDIGKINLFAKARIDAEFNITKLNYQKEFLKYVFLNQTLPSFARIVPVLDYDGRVDKRALDKLYDDYCAMVNSRVEGFIVHQGQNCVKYVRYKNGKMKQHSA